MVKDSLREETTGYGLDKPKNDFFAKAAEVKPIEKVPSAKSSDEMVDEYEEDDFDEDGIEEDLPSEDEPDVEVEEEEAKKGAATGSGNYGITVS